MSSQLSSLMNGSGTVTAPVSPKTPASSSPGSFNQPNVSLPGPVTDTAAKSWYEAMAKAWGKVLDQQAGDITSLSDSLSNGGQDQPSTLTLLTAASLKMQFMSTSASTSDNAVGQAMDSLGRKQ